MEEYIPLFVFLSLFLFLSTVEISDYDRDILNRCVSSKSCRVELSSALEDGMISNAEFFSIAIFHSSEPLENPAKQALIDVISN